MKIWKCQADDLSILDSLIPSGGLTSFHRQRFNRQLSGAGTYLIQHLAGEGVELEVTVEVRATRPDGFGDDKVRIVTENARTLKFDQFGFEDD
ncbi:hypothetical protein [Frankia sp. Cr1]|uniref:hypothetical protein n=1 Tax=Frankia sp. Cr1 TaxID=3073931 RepID=UPI002AD2293B|nr:hypothetical protein [Frankia sp. Cr1]